MAEIKLDDIRRQLEDISVKSHFNSKTNRTGQTEKSGENFSSFLKNAITEANQSELDANQSVNDLISGKETNIHNTLISLEKADISFKMMMQVRGKLMDAYQQIMRTSV